MEEERASSEVGDSFHREKKKRELTGAGKRREGHAFCFDMDFYGAAFEKLKLRGRESERGIAEAEKLKHF
eukprot:760121-Hanusia_phi.AAC.1